MALAGVVLSLIAAAAGASFWLATRPDGTQVVERDGRTWRPVKQAFAGSASCQGCHPHESALHAKSAHAKTLRRVQKGRPLGEHVNGQTVRDPLTGAEYSLRYADGKHLARLVSGPAEVDAEVEWEFGSGKHAHGYLVRFEGTLLDLRINWYREINGWYFASGQDKPTKALLTQPMGRALPADQIARCFSCHSTELRARDVPPEGVDGGAVALKLERTVPNVECEACHGPRQEHVLQFRSGKATTPVPPLTAAEVSAMCARCHSQPELREDHEVIARFQPWGLEQSPCYKQSSGKLSCLTCHDPHSDARPEPAFYDPKCLSCHSSAPAPHGAPAALCGLRKDRDCVSCHMRRDSTSMLHITFTDHRIGILKKEAK